MKLRMGIDIESLKIVTSFKATSKLKFFINETDINS